MTTTSQRSICINSFRNEKGIFKISPVSGGSRVEDLDHDTSEEHLHQSFQKHFLKISSLHKNPFGIVRALSNDLLFFSFLCLFSRQFTPMFRDQLCFACARSRLLTRLDNYEFLKYRVMNPPKESFKKYLVATLN